ncbi:MAG: hypothetical protein ABSH05_18205 [Bryobacteraceae bacterium]|jgi:hypothetical protein
MRIAAPLIFASLLASTLPVRAQEKKESVTPGVYRVEFNIRDGSEATAKAGRRYAMLIEANGKGTFRVGNRIPIATGGLQSGGGTEASARVYAQYQYFDVGVNIDCRLHESNGKVDVDADISDSTILEHEKGAAAIPPNPTVASIHLTVTTSLIPGKPALVASIDDPVSMRKFDVEVTVAKVD